jgi:hypothetical protein
MSRKAAKSSRTSGPFSLNTRRWKRKLANIQRTPPDIRNAAGHRHRSAPKRWAFLSSTTGSTVFLSSCCHGIRPPGWIVSVFRTRNAADRCWGRPLWPSSARYSPPTSSSCRGRSLPGCESCVRVRPACLLPSTGRRYSHRRHQNSFFFSLTPIF